MNTTLIIMAAGIGSRFGTGIKQLAKMAPNGEIIMDFSIYDAKAAGFTKVVFVIRKAIEAEFKEVIGNRLSKVMPVEYVYQELENLPDGYEVPAGRVKPWGTGQAILACKSVVKEPFVIINADDYYGKEAFIKLHDFLSSENENKEKMNLAMAGFSLKNTLSENGAVTRGVCVADENGYLEKVIETTGIQIVDGKIQCDNAEVSKWITLDTMVSMNMWAGYPDFLKYIDEGFTRFLDTLGENPEKKEYLLPNIVAELLEKNLASVKVLNTSDRWIGITYKEDIEPAQEKFHLMIEDGTRRSYGSSMVEKVDVYSDKSNGSKIYAFDYLRVIALVMILYDHLGGFYNPNWIVKKIIDFFFVVPLDIIQDFGAFGVSLFFLLSGFLFTYNGNYKNEAKKTFNKTMKTYVGCLMAFFYFIFYKD